MALIAVSIDGAYTDLPTPAVGGYEVRPEEITKSSRNTLGNLYKYRIAVKRSITLKWVTVSPAEKDMIMQATAGNSFQVKYFDIQEGIYKYGKFYRGNDLTVTPYPPFKDGEFQDVRHIVHDRGDVTMYDQVKPYVAVGVGIDPTASDDVTGVATLSLPMSNPTQIFDAKYFLVEGLATYEADGIPTSVSAGMIAPPEEPMDELNTSIWSKGISDANGNISFTTTISLSKAHTSALTLYFDAHEVTGTATFKSGATTVATVPFTTTGYRFQDSTVRTFDSLVIAVSHISAPYCHVRLVEVEFGASRTFGEDEITGNISLIRQIDPYQASMPVDELDFELINIEGDYDIDNPNTRIGEIALGTPVYLSFTTVEDGVQTTVRQGKYYICAHDGGEDSLKITAQDNRSIMQDLYPSLTLSTTRPIAESISDVFTAYNVPHTIDEDVADIYPNANYAFDDSYSLLDSVLYILQKWDVYCKPDLDGLMHITSYLGSVPTNPPITSEYLTEYPYISKNVAYNYVRIKHDTGYYDKDLRDNPQNPMLILNINNPLINTEAEARTLADKVASYVLANSEQVELSAIGIPSLDLRGNTAIEGRWTTREYAVSSIELTFDGGLEMVVRVAEHDTGCAVLDVQDMEGSDAERFRYYEQNRIISNVKALADMVGVTFEDASVTQADQFSVSLQNRIESAIEQICAKLRIDAPMETSWGARRGLTYRDFDRVEDWLHRAYMALNGQGGRIEWDESRNYDPYILFPDNWTGTGPYYYDLPTDLGGEYNDGLVWVHHSATPQQRADEYNAMITVVSSTEGVRLCAYGIKPKNEIPIIITRGLSPMHESATLQASKWTGTGPWTQTIIMANTVTTGVITISENTSSAQATAFAKAGISVSAVSGKNVTVRAIMSKPTVDLPVMVIYEQTEGS